MNITSFLPRMRLRYCSVALNYPVSRLPRSGYAKIKSKKLLL